MERPVPAGLLVVKRVWADREALVPRGRTPAVGRSHEEIGRRYRGIEGLQWPQSEHSTKPELGNGLADPNTIQLVQRYRNEHCPLECDLIYIAPPTARTPVPQGMFFLGFDFGYYESEWSQYSVIFNEVIYGLYAPLRAFATALNSSLLAPTISVTQQIEECRNAHLREGADLENDATPVALAVYGAP